MKVLLCSVPVLADPDLLRPFKLEVDASAVCVVVFPSLLSLVHLYFHFLSTASLVLFLAMNVGGDDVISVLFQLVDTGIYKRKTVKTQMDALLVVCCYPLLLL